MDNQKFQNDPQNPQQQPTPTPLNDHDRPTIPNMPSATDQSVKTAPPPPTVAVPTLDPLTPQPSEPAMPPTSATETSTAASQSLSGSSTTVPPPPPPPASQVATAYQSGGINKKKILLVTIVLLLLSLGIASYLVTQRQKSASRATEIPNCHTGGPPLAIDPICQEGKFIACDDIPSCTGLSNQQKNDLVSNYCKAPNYGILPSSLPANHGCKISLGCRSPGEGYCKEKGNCFECRFSRDNSLRTICPCKPPTQPPPPSPTLPQPTPTLPQKPSPTLTPTPPFCPKPAAVSNIKVTCPNCQ